MIYFGVTCFSIITLVNCAYHPDLWTEPKWHLFKLQYGKTYDTLEEEQHRQEIFRANVRTIAKHNFLYELGLHSYQMGVNEFSDLTSREFLDLYTMSIDYKELLQNNSIEIEEPLDEDNEYLTSSIDWRSKGAVTEVKNQGQCNSCWAFSTTGMLEGQWFRKTGKLVSLSEQNLVDCTGQGCNYGRIDVTVNYIIRNRGIATEASYPYLGTPGNCRYSRSRKGATATRLVTFYGEGALKTKVATVGPISTLLDVSASFQSYRGGIFYDPHCSPSRNKHFVLIVGYGTQQGRNYWLIKNSWGTQWGERGYMKIARDKNACGLGNYLNYPVV